MPIRRIFTLLLLLTACGCASGSYRAGYSPSAPSGFTKITSFCHKHQLEYGLNTLDDIIRMSSSDKEIRIMLNSSVGYFNGNIFTLPRAPFYIEGSIFIPNELEEIIFSNARVSFRAPFMINTIVIDPGHGGKDPGAISPGGVSEKDINLSVAKYLEEEMKTRGFKVILTRARDAFLTLEERVEVGKKYNADLFISIHTNSNRSRYVSGMEIYYLTPEEMSLKRSVDLARKDRFYPRRGSFDIQVILWDLFLARNYFFSVDIANVFYHTFKNMNSKVKPPRCANYHVLRNAYTPSLLIEVGYLSNAYEERMLKRKYYQKQIAETIASGVVALNKQYANFVLQP